MEKYKKPERTIKEMGILELAIEIKKLESKEQLTKSEENRLKLLIDERELKRNELARKLN